MALLTPALLSIEKIPSSSSSSNSKISIDSVPTDKDVARTDRLHAFYSEANHSNVKKLYDVLLTYCMYNFDLGKLKKHVFCPNSPVSVILLQIVMVSPVTHLVKNHESLSITSESQFKKKKRKFLGLIWRQTPKLVITVY